MIPEISASKVAAVIGLNRYQKPADVKYELLCKDKDIKARIAEIERTHGRRSFNQVVNEILREGPIRDCIANGADECRRTQDIAGVLDGVERHARVILDLRNDTFTPEVRKLIAAEVRGSVSKQRGLTNENAILDTYETARDVKVTERNTKTVRKDYGTFKLVGRTDGYVASENRIVDSKDRTRHWPQVPIYDEIQLRCYMDMTGATESELVERFPNGTTRHTKYANDPDKWATIQEQLERVAAELNAAATDEEELKRIVFAVSIDMSHGSSA
jgi:hypothetical protein